MEEGVGGGKAAFWYLTNQMPETNHCFAAGY